MSISFGLIVSVALFVYLNFLITNLGKMWVFVSKAMGMIVAGDKGAINAT